MKNFLIVLLSLLSLVAFSQKTKNQLEKEKEENLKKINETKKILQETKTKKNASLGQLNAINHEIKAHEKLITSISEEISYIDGEINDMQILISALESDLETLRKEYAEMIYAFSKNSKYYDQLSFLFGAEDFNQLLMRMKYFRQYSEARKYQLAQIEEVANSLTAQKEKLNQKKQEKNSLLNVKTIETENLNQLGKQQKTIVQELSKKEKELKKELDEHNKAVKKLERLITDLIAAEKEAARLKNTDVSGLSGSFAGNLGKLPWPVSHGTISQKFGKQAHPVLKGVYIDNLGIDIQTLKGEQVRCVFQGKVITVATVPGMNYVVMVQHGDYFTVYAKLRTVVVKTGQEIKAKDLIGEVYTDKNETSVLQFQIWKNNEKMDPEKWLRDK